MGFHWNLSDCKCPKIFRTLLSILADLNNAIVWMVLILPLISNSSNPFAKPLGTVLSAPTTMNITVTFKFHTFFQSSSKVQVSV